MVDLRQSEGWAGYLKAINFEVLDISGQKAYAKKIPFLGTVIKIQRPDRLPTEREIDALSKKLKALFIKLEPEHDYNPGNYPGFDPDQSPNLPTRTIRVDLRKERKELWKDLSSDARQSIKKVGNSLRIEINKFGEQDFDEKLKSFHKLLEQAGQRGNFSATSLADLTKKSAAFGKDVLLLLVHENENEEPLAGALILKVKGSAFDQHAASSTQGLSQKASYLLLWEAIKYLKEDRKLKYFDLEGIADPRFPQTKKWEGFTVFKRKWGGEEVAYPLPLIKFYSWPLKLLFTLGAALQR